MVWPEQVKNWDGCSGTAGTLATVGVNEGGCTGGATPLHRDRGNSIESSPASEQSEPSPLVGFAGAAGGGGRGGQTGRLPPPPLLVPPLPEPPLLKQP
jgi:hypothetical protein